MWETLKANAIAFHASFHKSGTIVFARLQILFGAIWTVLTMTDLAPLISNPKILTGWLIFSGVVTEMSRRSGTYADEDGHLLPRRDHDQTINVNVNTPGPTSGSTK